MYKETYWNYTCKTWERKEHFENGKPVADGPLTPIKTQFDPNEIGKYSSLTSAVDGFLSDEMSQSSEIFFSEEEGSLRLLGEVYHDFLGSPISPMRFSEMKRTGEQMSHAFFEAIFIKHENTAASLEDFSSIKRHFKEIKEHNGQIDWRS